MGWWLTGNGDDTIGDGPADILMDAFKDIVARHNQSDQPLLTLSQLLDLIAATLRLEPQVILSEGKSFSIRSIIAEVENKLLDKPQKVSSSSNPLVDETDVRILFDAFTKIAIEYEEMGLNRKPRVSELLETIVFVLGYRPKSYAFITEDLPLRRLYAE